jgi:kynurenine formamidase
LGQESRKLLLRQLSGLLEREVRVAEEAGWRLVDLSLLISEEVPASWPQSVPFQRRIWNWFEDVEDAPEILMSRNGSFFTEVIQMDEHTATHFDAPAHFLPECSHLGSEPLTGDMVPLARLCGRASVIDVRGVEEGSPAVPGQSPLIDVADLERWEGENHRVAAGEVVLFRTDWDERYFHPGAAGRHYAEHVLKGTTPGWPAPNVECVLALADRGVSCIGIDAPSIGPVQDAAPVHIEGFRRGLLFVEGLAHLAELPVAGSFFMFLPLKIARSSGAPGRAVAWVPSGSLNGSATPFG